MDPPRVGGQRHKLGGPAGSNSLLILWFGPNISFLANPALLLVVFSLFVFLLACQGCLRICQHREAHMFRGQVKARLMFRTRAVTRRF